MISLFEGRDSQSAVKTRDAVERVDILLNRASRYLIAGQNNLAEEAVLSAQAILEQQEVISVFDHLRALIIVGRLYSARGNPVAALATHKKVSELIFDHVGDLDIDDPRTTALLRLHEYTLVEAREEVEIRTLERMAS